MGNNQSNDNTPSTTGPSGNSTTGPSGNKKIKFGSIHDPGNPRPGYYYNQNTRTLKYHTHEIILLPGENVFKKLKYGYAKTNKRVFYKGIHIPGAVPENFSTLTIPEVKELGNPALTKLNSVLGILGNNSYNSYYYKGKLIDRVK
jgi:hypothetical protein